MQPPFNMWKIDTKYLQGYRLVKKKDKDSRKNKFVDILSINKTLTTLQSRIGTRYYWLRSHWIH